jgi:ribulose-5-phosphate 4-epimerase/fuculose-1-phosphate aldolase
VLELLARMEVTVRAVAPEAQRPAQYLVDKHFLRKHGKDAYYGQG